MRILVAGWFSYADGLATAGDLHAAVLVGPWLTNAGYPCDVAVVPPFGRGVDWRTTDLTAYSHVVFVCGPFGQYPKELRFLDRFAGSCLVGINLSMEVALDRWNPFDLLLGAGAARVRPGQTSRSGSPRRRLQGAVGCALSWRRTGDPEGAVDRANAAISRLLASREMGAVVAVDTRLDSNVVGLRSPSEVEALLARMDVVVSDEGWHGTVLSLEERGSGRGDRAQTGGGRASCQAEAIGWPSVLREDTLTDDALLRAFGVLPDARGAGEEPGSARPAPAG